MLIDTHKAIKDLTGAGVPEKHAEMIVTVVSRANEQVATKKDLEEMEATLRRDMRSLREDMEAQGQELTEKIETQGQRLTGKIEAQGSEMATQQDLATLEERLKKHTLRAVLIGVGLNLTAVSIGVAIILGVLG